MSGAPPESPSEAGGRASNAVGVGGPPSVAEPRALMRPDDGPPGDGVRPLPDDRLAALVLDVRRRLRPVCGDWGEAGFETLVHRVARTQLRWTAGTDGR